MLHKCTTSQTHMQSPSKAPTTNPEEKIQNSNYKHNNRGKTSQAQSGQSAATYENKRPHIMEWLRAYS